MTRFRAGTRSRQAQSRAKKLDKMDRIERAPRDGRGLGFGFDKPSRSGRVVLELEGATLSAGDKLLLDKAELWLERGEHVTLVGPNGAGKTTLIETLAGQRPLEHGKLRTGHNVELGYLSQHAEEVGQQGTVLEAAQRATGLTPGKARALLGRFLFSGADAEKPVAGLSGGERRRLSLAILVQSGANLLILDEPTNHLDLESREALEDALLAFQGSLILVSHDRALLDAVGSRTLAIEDGTLHSHQGGWADYVRVREERKAAAAAKTRGKAASNGKRRESQQPKAELSKGRKRRMAAVEGDIQSAESALAKIEDELGGSLRVVHARAVGRVDPPPRGREARRGGALRGAGWARGRLNADHDRRRRRRGGEAIRRRVGDEAVGARAREGDGGVEGAVRRRDADQAHALEHAVLRLLLLDHEAPFGRLHRAGQRDR